MDDRNYEEPPLDEFDAWLYHKIFGMLAEQGLATAFDTRQGGKPGGYRENRRGQWNRVGVETYLPVYAAANILVVRYWISEESERFFMDLYNARPSWFGAWEQAAIRDPDVVSDSMEPTAIAEALKTWQGAYQLLLGRTAQTVKDSIIVSDGMPDYDPVRDAPRIYALDPFPFQTIRRVQLRDSRGRFTGQSQTVKVKTLEIPHTSEIGSKIRIIDADKSRKKPKGAIARIQTSPGRKGRAPSYAYVVPYDGKHLVGAKLEDKRHAAMRARNQKESVQLYDHRTGKKRQIELIVTKRSKNYGLAISLIKAIEEQQNDSGA